MKKILISLSALLVMAYASSNSTNSIANDPFSQMDKLFEIQMKQMQQMQKQMDEMFKVFEKSNFNTPRMPVIYSSGGMMSSGLKDKGDHYELDIKISKATKTDFDLKTKDGILTIKVSQSNAVDKNSTNQMFKSESVSNYMQSFTLPKDADTDKITHELKDDKIVVTIPKKESKSK